MKKIIIIFILILIVIFSLQIYLPREFSVSNEVIFEIKKGQGFSDIAFNLQKEGLIWWSPALQIYVLATNAAGKLQAGTYILSTNMNVPQIVEKFIGGDIGKDRITIIEGWNLRNIGFYFENRGMFRAEELWEIAGFPAADYAEGADFSDKYAFLESKPTNVGLEGFLFPDTYEITRDMTVKEIIEKMLDNFDKKLPPALRAEISKQDKTIFQIVTMASIIEKEVPTKEDKEIVAGIFWKRLKLGMPLQADATIAYIKGVDQWRYSFEDTRIESPYNTYFNYGLPRGPISNPGIDSILAAIYPQSSEYLYYLSTTEGKTIFSRTLEEHNVAKAKYLK